jgi:hypothetical protein
VPETLCGDLMTLGGERAHQIAMDMLDVDPGRKL